jgi:hypothetical protein
MLTTASEAHVTLSELTVAGYEQRVETRQNEGPLSSSCPLAKREQYLHIAACS